MGRMLRICCARLAPGVRLGMGLRRGGLLCGERWFW